MTLEKYFKSKEFKRLGKRMRRTMKKRINFFYRKMKKNPYIAQHVRRFRIDKGYSWRCVAGEIGVRYPQLNIAMWDTDPNFPSGHQPDGMWLCDAAMRFYKESTDDGWN